MKISRLEILMLCATVCFMALLYFGTNFSENNTEIVISENELSEREIVVTNDGIVLDIETGLININTADLTTLQRLPNIGEVLAGRIIDYREQNGEFKDPMELMDIEGIGEKTYLGLSGLIILEE